MTERREDNERWRILALAVLLTVPAWYALSAFIDAIAWGIVLAIASWPLIIRLESWQTRPSRTASAALITVGLATTTLAPLICAGAEAAQQMFNATIWMRHAQAEGVAAPEWLHRLPFAAADAQSWWEQHLSRPGSAFGLLRDHDGKLLLQGWLSGAGRGAGIVVSTFVFAMMTTFTLLHGGEMMARICQAGARRAFGQAGVRALHRAAASVKGTAASVVVIGAAEGLIFAGTFKIGAIPHGLMLAVLATLAAAVPFGTIAIGSVAAAEALADGHQAWGGAVFMLSIALVAAADYYVRPKLASAGAGLPLTAVLLSLLGGVAAFGIVGLFIGPAAAAAAAGAWTDWIDDDLQDTPSSQPDAAADENRLRLV